MAEILVARTAEQLDHVRRLMRAFVDWHRRRHQEDLALIDAYFDDAAFESELASLPGKYAPPGGRLLLATHRGRPAGCVALRRIDNEACEMKRMFVDEAVQGQGVGRALGHAIIDEAVAAGCRTMYLDTSVRQHEAQALYRRLGFLDIEPYYDLPQDLRDWLVFMKLSLRGSACP